MIAAREPIVQEGILRGFLTSRETAAQLGQGHGGSMRADGWARMPLVRMTNLHLEPGTGSLEELISEVDEGIYFESNRSWSIDDKRLNFQFGTQMAWEIKNGKLGRLYRDATYTGVTPVFWGSLDRVAGPDEWVMYGLTNCGKGQPGQHAHVSHGASPARFRNVQVGVKSCRRLDGANRSGGIGFAGAGAGMSEALEIAERALEHASDDAEVYVGVEHSGFARYAGSEVHQPTLIDDTSVQLRVVRGQRSAIATTNRTDDAGLAELAGRAAELVAVASEDPDVVPPASPAEHPEPGGYDEETAKLGPEGQARAPPRRSAPPGTSSSTATSRARSANPRWPRPPACARRSG